MDITTHHLPNPYLQGRDWADNYVQSVMAWLGPMLRPALALDNLEPNYDMFDEFVENIKVGFINRREDLEHDYIVNLLHAVKD